jgi:hypothetical protein
MSMEVREIRKFFLLLDVILTSTQSTVQRNLTLLFERELKKAKHTHEPSKAFDLNIANKKDKLLGLQALQEKGIPFFITDSERKQLQFFDQHFKATTPDISEISQLLKTLIAHLLVDKKPAFTIMDFFRIIQTNYASRWDTLQTQSFEQVKAVYNNKYWQAIGYAFIRTVKKSHELQVISKFQFDRLFPPSDDKRTRVDPKIFDLFFPGLSHTYRVSKRGFAAGMGFLRFPNMGDVQADGHPAISRFYTVSEKKILSYQYPVWPEVKRSPMDGHAIYCATAIDSEPSISYETFFKIKQATEQALMFLGDIHMGSKPIEIMDSLFARYVAEVYVDYAYGLKKHFSTIARLIAEAPLDEPLKKKQYQLCYDHVRTGAYTRTTGLTSDFKVALEVTYGAVEGYDPGYINSKIALEAHHKRNACIKVSTLEAEMLYAEECLEEFTAIFLAEYASGEGWSKDPAERIRLENQLLDLSGLSINSQVIKQMSFGSVISLMRDSCLEGTWTAFLSLLVDIQPKICFQSKVERRCRDDLEMLRARSRNRGFYRNEQTFSFKPVKLPVVNEAEEPTKQSLKQRKPVFWKYTKPPILPMSPTFFYQECLKDREVKSSEGKELTRSKSASFLNKN